MPAGPLEAVNSTSVVSHRLIPRSSFAVPSS